MLVMELNISCSLLPKSYEVDPVIIPILEMRGLRLRGTSHILRVL